ncbi:MAG: hypothetical protein FJ128_03395 [Deltaproteobacteria bacterium]|nr:hypothetical protein [Deltaproteobacteria bacterium]
MEKGFRQEVLNVALAQLLAKHGVVSAPEVILKARPGQKRRMPDILVSFLGLRLVIEGEVADTPGAEDRALDSARKRVEEGLAHISMAVVYPASLRKLDSFDQLQREMAESQLKVAIVDESEETGYSPTELTQIPNILNNTFDKLVREDVVARAAAILDDAVEKGAPVFAAITGFPEEAARILGIRTLPRKKKSPTEEEEE